MNKVAALIINRDTAEYLKGCLDSFERQRYDGGISVWVVDNASSDESVTMALRDHPVANIVCNARNEGYARACNLGIGMTCEPYVLVLNSDTVLSPDTVSELVDFLDANPGVGVAAPRLLNSDGTIQLSVREFPSVKDAFMHAFLGLVKADNPYSVRYRKQEWDHATECEADWVSGAFMALRRDALERVGLFDEGYHMYVEDVDLCWRMRCAGWSVAYLPRGDVIHHVGLSSRFAPTRMALHHHRGMLRFHRKTYDGPCRFALNAAVTFGVALRFTFIAAYNTFSRIRAALGGSDRIIMPGRQ